MPRWARCLVAVCLAAAAPAALALPGFAEVRAAHRPSDLTVLDRHGVPLQTLRIDDRVRRLDWVPLADISPALMRAVVLGEDRGFYEHSGVDWGAAARSAWSNLWNTRTRGASTLTMQLAGLLDDELARPRGGRSAWQKRSQVAVARELDARWTKSQILEAYLNRVAWRGEIVGIGALSQTLFGKWPSGLDAHEAAIAAALLRGPNAGADRVAQRACGLLQAQGLACAGVTALATSALARRGGMPLGEQLAPHAARLALAGAMAAQPSAASSALLSPARSAASLATGPGATPAGLPPPASPLRTTLDASLQRIALAALREQLTELAPREVEDGAVVVLDNASGEVLAWVGSSGRLSDAPQVDAALARRQPGSTLKPFVYALAFEERLLTPATLLDDAPAQIATAAGLYLPQNYEPGHKGWVSARTALAASLNVPAVRVGEMLGADRLVERLNAFGLALPHGGGYYGASLALGSADVTLAALTNAYRALANDGQLSAYTLRPAAGAPPPRRRVADAAAVFLVTDILSDNDARAPTFGWDSALATRVPAAVKTGTSKDMRDNWCIGYTERYTVGVWVGNASGAPMHDVSGVSGAAPVWRTLVQQLHAGRPARPARPPAGVVRARATFADAREPARDEWFVAGTEATAGPRDGTPREAFGIASPRDGSLFAIDPDIPPAAQRIVFEGERGVWVLDGRRLGAGDRWSWSPWPGRHELELRDPAGRRVQAVRFEVRGAGIKPGAKPPR